MRTVVIGEFRSSPDEGMRRTAQELSRALERESPVFRFEILDAFKPAQWVEARDFEPDNVLLVPGPSYRGLLLLRGMSAFTGADVSSTLTLNPEDLGLEWLQQRLVPGIVFTHSDRTRERFKRLGATCCDLAMGVDVDRFNPPSKDERVAAREWLGLERSGSVVLHVGHLKEDRNLRRLIPLAEEHDVLVVASTATDHDVVLRRDLETAGVTIIDDYLEDIERVYRAADCYVFPVVEANNSTEIPMSILEAIATGLPVVSTHYAGVPRAFSGFPEVEAVEEDEIAAAVTRVLDRTGSHGGQGKRLRELSWDGTAEQILSAFEEARASD